VADPCVTRFYLSANTTLDAADAVLGERAFLHLAQGKSASGSTGRHHSCRDPAGTYYVIGQSRRGHAVPETAETNNTRAEPHGIGPDLGRVRRFGAHDRRCAATVTVTDTTKNQGGGEARFSDHPVLSLDQYHDRCRRHGARPSARFPR